MARPKGDPSDLIRRLEAALKIAKPRDVLSADDMAKCTGMTWRNLLMTHIEPDSKFPIERRGAEGVAWQFRVVKVLRHMLKRANERIASNEASARRVQQLTGFEIPDEAGSAIGIHDVGKLIDANVKAQNEKVRQGHYVPRAEVDAFVIDYNSMIQSGILGASQKADPVGSLPPDVRGVMDEELRNLCVRLQALTDTWLTGRYEASVAGRTGKRR
jgi:hypothetical protein